MTKGEFMVGADVGRGKPRCRCGHERTLPNERSMFDLVPSVWSMHAYSFTCTGTPADGAPA